MFPSLAPSTSPPTPAVGWTRIGDAASVLLFNGAELQSSCCNSQTPTGPPERDFNGPNNWITSGNVLQSTTDESGYTLLTNGKVLMIDTKRVTACPNPTQSSELYTVTNPDDGCRHLGVRAAASRPPLQLTGRRIRRRNHDVQQQGICHRRKQECHGGLRRSSEHMGCRPGS